jgi:pyridoxamine 5'-phosphate oxidase
MQPLKKFLKWYQLELSNSKEQLPAACCLSTLGTDGYPNARFLSLKEVRKECFVITGSISSKKSLEIEQNPKVALTFWWAASMKQIRIQGNARPIENELAVKYFRERSLEARLVSNLSDQGKIISDLKLLKQRFEEEMRANPNKNTDKPENWGGFYINPVRIEFMKFKTSRLHHRELYSKNDKVWNKTFLQP